MKRPKLLCILHRSPPKHGAAKVGDFIGESKKLKEAYECKFITIKSSETIGDIGKVNLKKLYLVAELYIRIFWALISFKPNKVYYTASINGVAFYRDLLVSTLWKTYKFFKSINVFYHYHTKGINDYVSASERNLKLTRFFLKDVNLILLSPMLAQDFRQVQTYKDIYFLPNGVENPMAQQMFEGYVEKKYEKIEKIEVLYLSNMIKLKGYFEVLKLAKTLDDRSIHYHFAGGWQNEDDKKEFFAYIEKNNLEERVTFHGFVNGSEKEDLFKRVHLFMFPTRYPNEAFPLSILESLSYGVPVVTTDEGSIPYILDEKCGMVLKEVNRLPKALQEAEDILLNIDTSIYCRKRYLENFSMIQFERKLVKVLK